MDFSLGTPGSPSNERSFLKQCRSMSELDDADTRLKMPRTDSTYASSHHQQQQQHKHSNSSDEDTRHLDPSSYALRQYQQQQQQMYSSRQQHHQPQGYAASAYCSSPFTASQWAELEQQALIFKHMMARATVPQELLNPIRRSLLLSSTANGPQNMTWSGYQQGMYGSPLDIEPGRCRRTDGKKWRCSRPVVPEQKYCERHVHRGRSRSKKAAAEAQAAQAAQASQGIKNNVTSSFQSGSSKIFGASPQQQQVNICLGSSTAEPSNKDQRFLDSKAHFGLRPEQQLLFSELSGSTRELATQQGHQNQNQIQQPSLASRLSTSSMSMAPSKSYDNIHQSTMWEHHHQDQQGGGANRSSASPLHHFFQQSNHSDHHNHGDNHGDHHGDGEDQHIRLASTSSWQEDESTRKNAGIFSSHLKLAIQDSTQDDTCEDDDDEEETRIALRPPPPGGPLAEALRSSSCSTKVALSSPTGVLQKASCFSDCSSSSASSSPGSSVKTTT